ncbi:hypothetical protein SNE40_013756 [Patella caerulea]
MLTTIIITGAGFLVNPHGQNEFINASLAPFGDSKLWVGVTYVSMFVHAALWACSISFCSVIIKCLTTQFKLLADEITESVNSATSFPAKIHLFKRLHLDLCKLVDLLNQDFKYIFASVFLLNILILLCVGYSVIKTVLVDVSLITVMTAIAMLSIHKVVFLSLVSGDLHEQIHKPLPSLYNVRGQNMNLEDMLEVNLFIARLQESSVGITAMDVLLVKKGTVLTLFGVFLTYLFVVIQFSL